MNIPLPRSSLNKHSDSFTVFFSQSSCDPVANHSESISHTVTVPLQTTLGTLEEIACWGPPPFVPQSHAQPEAASTWWRHILC